MKYIFLCLVFLGIICAVPLNLKNDLDGNLLHVLSIKHDLNFETNQGLPVLSDPINFYWHPLTPLVLTLPVEYSVRIIDAICWVFTLVFAYFLLRYFDTRKQLALWLALTYGASSYFLARVIAGHFEKVLSYPLIPLFFLAIVRLQQKPDLKRSGFLAIVFYLLLASTDMYNFFYLCVGFAIYIAFKRSKYFVLSIILAILFSAVRWLPMLSVLQHLFKIPDPYSGSQNLIGLFLQMVLPKAGLITSLVPTNFGWWEKTAFIGPLFIVSLLVIKKRQPILIAIFALVCIAIAMPASVFSPWHWLLKFPQFTMFHVPTRVFSVLTLSVILAAVPVLSRWKTWGIRLVQINVCLLLGFWLFIFHFRMMPTIDWRYKTLMSYPHPSFATILYPAFDQPVLEREWQMSWQLFHTTHGTYVQDSPAADWTNHLVNEVPYTNSLPDYVVWPDNKQLPFSGTPVASESGITLYKIANSQILNTPRNNINIQLYYAGAIISLLSMYLWYKKSS